MVKKCSVKNCLSGSTAERKRNVELNRRQTTLFQVPKCPDALKKWNLALSQHLLHKNFVCELHFKDDDIIRTFDRINLPNGEVFDLPKERFHLKAGAIPVQVNMLVDHHDARVIDPSNTNPLPMQIVSEEVVINEELDNGSSAGKHMEDNSNISDNFSDSRQQMYSSSIVNEIIEDTTSHTGDLELEWQILYEENYRPAAFDDNLGTFSLSTILQALKDQSLPQNWCWSKQSDPQKLLILYYVDSFLKKLKLEVTISINLIIQITIMETGVTVNYNYSLTSVIHFFNMLQEIEKSQFCSGAGVNNGRCSTRCDGILQSPEKYKRFMKMNRCFSCRSLRKRLLMSSKQKNNDTTKRYITIKRKLHVKQKNLYRLKKKNHQLKEKMEQLKHQCAVIKDNIIEEEIADLPEAQKQAVRACFQAAKVKNSKQRRYTIEWVYECLLIRIKGPAVYDKLRERQILPLPCKDTLNRYINKLDSAFGFPKAIFDTLRLKASRMESYDKRGTLLIDEIALSEGVKLNTKTMEFNGFVNLGDYTPQNLINERADHALVFMYQSFRGTWVQVLGYFLSKSAVTKDVLHKLIIDCIIQLEKAGMQVDVVTSDGAQWNRGAWKIFGIEDQKFSCTHPYDTSRQLWFMSDFPHLLKCFRTKILEGPSFWTPDGIVKKIHWEVLLQHELQYKPNLKVSYKLTPEHIHPEGYQKMNVRLAEEQFFGIVRSACGCNEHPDPIIFGQVFRLLCSYSLVTPPKGSNVTAVELLQSLMETKESLMLSQDKKSKWLQKLDSIIDNGFLEEDDIYRKKSVAANDPHEHHDYDVVNTSEFVVSYIAGYVARKMQRFSRCHRCLASLESDKSSHRDRVIDLMSEQCIRPSNNLYSLIQQLENIVLTVVGTKTVGLDTMNHILDKVAEEKSLPFVGCQEHQFTLMKTILNYFITIRGHFLANHINKNYKQKSIKNKKLRKISKLV